MVEWVTVGEAVERAGSRVDAELAALEGGRAVVGGGEGVGVHRDRFGRAAAGQG